MHQDGENTSHYVDSVGYREIPEFTKELSVSAENSPEKSRLERFESLPEAMAKFTEYRGKETEDKPDMARATLGFSVNGSEFDLIHVRNHDISLYMDRFDALYGQGKMEHLMPTANQKHIVEDVPFTEWENPYIDTKSQTMGREETELAFRLADRHISIQEATEGYDYIIYDMNYRELDGVYMTIRT